MRRGVEEEEEDGKVRERIAGCEMNGWQSREGEKEEKIKKRWRRGTEKVIDSG